MARMAWLKRICKELLVALALYVATWVAFYLVLQLVGYPSRLALVADAGWFPFHSDSAWVVLLWMSAQVLACWLVQQLTKRTLAHLDAGSAKVGSVTVTVMAVAICVGGAAVLAFKSYEVVIRRLGGFSLVDCGRVFLDEQRTASRVAVESCVTDAFTKGTPFVARYDQPGFESNVSESYVLSPSGALYVVTYDSDPSGVGFSGPSTKVKKCQEPPGFIVVGTLAQPVRLQCE